MKELFSTFREDEKEQRQLNIEAAKRNVGNQTEAEKKLLLEEGLDDFVSGGQTRAGGVELGIGLGAAALAKPTLATTAITGGANLIKKYPLRSLEVALTGLGGAGDPEDKPLETIGYKLDTMLGGPKPMRLARIFNQLFPEQVEGGKRFFSQLFGQKQPVTPEGLEMPIMKSVGDEGTGSSKGFSKATSPEYANIVTSGMKRMGMQDDVFDLDLYDLNSPILNEMSDPLGGTVMKSGMRRGKKLTKRNWLEYFLTPESLKGNFEALKKVGKVEANQTWEGFLKSKGLKTQAIQAHHINPLYDSIHLFDGVKWGSDEYWDIITTLIDRGARPGIVERQGMSNIIKTLGASARTDTPHGVAHEFYRDIMPTFFNEKNRAYMKLSHKNRMEMTKRWAGVVNRSENIVYEAHRAWEALNPEFRIDFDELVERMAKYDDGGVLKGVHKNYQVPDIKLLVQKVQYEEFLQRLVGDITPVKKNLPMVMDNKILDPLNEEFVTDLASGMTKKELQAKWGKKWNLKAIGAKQLNFFDDIRKLN